MPTAERADEEKRRARRMWRLLDPVHAITYFAPESRQEFDAAGLKGFWMGYFAGRSAPMGAVGPATVNATFFNFSPAIVWRALPDAWARATPERVLEARLAGVDRALGRILVDVDDPVATARAAELARAATENITTDGRPLAAANAALTWPTAPLLVLWQAATILREHRGDGHVAALVTAGLDGCEAHVSFAATGVVTREVLQPSRGWTDEEWAGAQHRLAERGWTNDDGTLSALGLEGRRDIEDITDALAAEPWRHLGTQHTDELAALLRPLAHAVVDSGAIPVLNPIGLPPPA